MAQAMLEHVNFTVSDPQRTAAMLCDLFGWRIRWQGDSIHDGMSIHVGADDNYLAIYGHPVQHAPERESYWTRGGLNHIGVVVDDLDATEKKVIAAGFTPRSHADYEPGRRFYFDDDDGVEFEVVSYT